MKYKLHTEELIRLSKIKHILPIYVYKNGKYCAMLKQSEDITKVICYSDKFFLPVEIDKSSILLFLKDSQQDKITISWVDNRPQV